MTVTIFKDLSDRNNPHRITIHQALQRIKNGNSKAKIDEVRERVKYGDDDYKVLKKGLPLVLFSVADTKETASKRDGKPTHREDESATKHSGLFVIDFDNCDVVQKTEQLKKDPYIYAIWLAPSGRGVKGLVKCPPVIKSHPLYYTAFLDRYPELDPTSRNIARGTFESYDPNIYINENSLVWDKQMTKEEFDKNKEKSKNRRGAQIISTAVAMIRSSYEGNRHDTILKASHLLGGYVASGRVDEKEAVKILEEEARQKITDGYNYKQTIADGIAHGKTKPLHESKKIEKTQQFLRRSDGSYDFLADNEEMTEYEVALINGTLEMGLPTGLNDLNTHWMYKKHHLVWFAGLDNVGKSFLVWYWGVLTAMLHGWKIVLHSAENSDGQVRKKLKELYLGKSLKVADDEELTIADDFVKNHFRIISSKQFHTLEDFLLKCEILYDEGFEFDLVIGEPFNSFDPSNADRYSYTIHSLNVLRVFKENYATVWIADHINTTAARAKDKDGYSVAPYKSDVEYGQMKVNKTDDFLILHRVVNHPYRKWELEIHVNKIKDVETGGFPTEKDKPVILLMNQDRCGYSCNGIDPVKEYWRRNK